MDGHDDWCPVRADVEHEHRGADILLERTCGAYGHSLGRIDWYAPEPVCVACHAILKLPQHSTGPGIRKYAQSVYCHGRLIGEVDVIRRAGLDPFYAIGIGGNIGRRPTRAQALAAVLASHECPA